MARRPGVRAALAVVLVTITVAGAVTAAGCRRGVAVQPSPSPIATEPKSAVRAAVERAPFLTEAAAAAIVADQQRRGIPVGGLEDAGLIVAVAGLDSLPPDRSRALGDSLRDVYAALQFDRGARLEALLNEIRDGNARPEGVGEAVALLSEGLSRVPESSRARLQTEFERAVVTTLARRAEAAQTGSRPASDPRRPR